MRTAKIAIRTIIFNAINATMASESRRAPALSARSTTNVSDATDATSISATNVLKATGPGTANVCSALRTRGAPSVTLRISTSAKSAKFDTVSSQPPSAGTEGAVAVPMPTATNVGSITTNVYLATFIMESISKEETAKVAMTIVVSTATTTVLFAMNASTTVTTESTTLVVKNV